ncbi:GNAT family N-acetyltransferase [Streptomyces sp. NPDC057743]|uniref:GNAT family N-acetyltransferase n=1 Tax=Streptomyces sp. NPDC057743 TaxID=3346236 RepID=UPI00368ADAE8
MSIDLRHFTTTTDDVDGIDRIRAMLLDVHDDCYAEQLDDPFHTRERFGWFVNTWSARPGFACVVGYDGGEPVGFAYGAPAVEGHEWWRGFLDPAPTDPWTFALSELMVRPKWRKTGTAQRLHEALLAERPEALAALLVDANHPKVEALYASWGYRKAGNQQPFPDSPNFTVMLRALTV